MSDAARNLREWAKQSSDRGKYVHIAPNDAVLMAEEIERLERELAAAEEEEKSANINAHNMTVAYRDCLNDLGATRDMLDDARLELDAIREALGVSVEPHQSLHERILEAAQVKQPPQTGERP